MTKHGDVMAPYSEIDLFDTLNYFAQDMEQAVDDPPLVVKKLVSCWI